MRAIDVRDLLENPGTTKTVPVDEPVAGLQSQLALVADDAPLAGALVLESVVEGVFVRGSVEGTMTLRCARCLKEFEGGFEAQMSEVVPREAGPEDDYALEPDLTLDPEPMIRDAVVLSMPFSPLCKPDCLGLCERCGGDRNLGECACAEAPADPRWAGLEHFVDES
jgi:uncharacterized protein